MNWDEGQHPRNPDTGEFVENNRWIAQVAARLPGSTAELDVFYHGTVGDPDVDELDQILPASQHRMGVTHRHMTDPDYAYAAQSERSAWHYAELAWNNRVSSDREVPRVFRVRATGPVEEDPFYDEHRRPRSVHEGDVRSRHPFEILDELPTPDHFIRDPDDDWD